MFKLHSVQLYMDKKNWEYLWKNFWQLCLDTLSPQQQHHPLILSVAYPSIWPSIWIHSSTLYLYFVFLFCILYFYFVYVFCICIHLSLASPLDLSPHLNPSVKGSLAAGTPILLILQRTLSQPVFLTLPHFLILYLWLHYCWILYSFFDENCISDYTFVQYCILFSWKLYLWFYCILPLI